jgi:hypothetical protein
MDAALDCEELATGLSVHPSQKPSPVGSFRQARQDGCAGDAIADRKSIVANAAIRLPIDVGRDRYLYCRPTL